ncbi:membrane protein [Reticulibacter mediterranei]|uniref:Membrane protein n=1 Tax=Reticulibacter mediterranei TaxID=2778369 RepID=A0A8J3IFF2_9CHLR|nr:membrane protein [Reticulibacter mediterranei]
MVARVSGSATEACARLGVLSPQFTREDANITVAVGGREEVLRQIGVESQHDLVRTEGVSLVIMLVLLLFVFRSVVAAVLPLVISMFAIFGSLLTLRIIASFTEVSSFALNLATMLGLGLSVDYSLFIVSRFREELRSGKEVHDAVVRTVEAAGRTVIFSGLTFAISLSALLLFPYFYLRSFAYAGIGVIVAGVLSALLTLPAVLTILGRRIDRGTVWRAGRSVAGEGFWHRIAMFVMRRPVPVGIAGVALLVILGLPFLNLNFGIADDRILPLEASSRQVQEQIRQNFAAEETDAMHVVATDVVAPATHSAEIERYAIALSRIPGIAQVDALTGSYANGERTAAPIDWSARFASERGTWLSVVSSEDRLNRDPFGLVRDVRATHAPFAVEVGGPLAEALDFRSALLAFVPVVVGVIAVVTFIVIFLMTGSLVMPLKAIILNFLSLSATFGALVWIFQEGNLSTILNFTPSGTLEISMPVLIFCVAFGLSMDYEVFIMTRIKEEYDRTGDNVHSVATGLEQSGPLVTAAAVLLAVVFVALTTSGVVFFKILGIGLTLAVLLDASLIRALLVPAFMRLMGNANWWAPAALQRLQRRFGLND